MNNNYDQLFFDYHNFVNNEIDKIFAEIKDVPPVLKDAMEYAVVDGGKRIRPILCLATADMLNLKREDVIDFAVAIEFIHSYSLIHDDLPAMDNDDYRRGKLSTHKKFGEATGILAGDALLNFAFEHCLNKPNFTLNDAKALKILAECAGSIGMIKGQVLDLQNEKNPNPNEEILYDIYLNKTAKLIMAPVLIASALADFKYFEELKRFSYNLGVMFQITDDIMDVTGTVESIGKTPNKDEKAGKLTSVKIFGLKGAKEKLKVHYDLAIESLKKIGASDFLFSLTKKLYDRKK